MLDDRAARTLIVIGRSPVASCGRPPQGPSWVDTAASPLGCATSSYWPCSCGHGLRKVCHTAAIEVKSWWRGAWRRDWVVLRPTLH